jgi:hypothetical protein
MTVTTKGLTQAAGISAAVAGALFIAVQINHPAMDVSSVTTTEWVVRQSAKTVMAAAALAGITGMYLRQVRQIGILGLVGYLVFGFGYLVMFGVEFAGGYVLPALAHTAPGYVNDVLAAGHRRPGQGATSARCRRPSPSWASATWQGGVLFGHRAVPRPRPGPLGFRTSRPRHPGHGRPARACRTRSSGRSRSRPASP